MALFSRANMEALMAAPTQNAEIQFSMARRLFRNGYINRGASQLTPFELDTSLGLGSMTEGLGDLAIGLRATYILLSEVNRKLDQLTVARAART
jgi:hypothetical protein